MISEPADLTLTAPAKLNLFLHITGRRDDGYHALQTVFQLVDAGDEMAFVLTDDDDITLNVTQPELDHPDNLVLQAARLLRETTGVRAGARIRLDKRLPAGGGLGGGSSDAATTLLALNRLWQCGLDLPALARLGLRLGADVPVFIHGRSAWAEGVGEQLQVIDLAERWYLVLTPDCRVATNLIFSHPQLTRDTAPITIPAFPFSGSKNDCQPLVSSLFPPVQAALDWLSQFGESRLTGTGASVFTAFETRETAEQVLAQAPQQIGTGFIARGVNISPTHKTLKLLN